MMKQALKKSDSAATLTAGFEVVSKRKGSCSETEIASKISTRRGRGQIKELEDDVMQVIPTMLQRYLPRVSIRTGREAEHTNSIEGPL